jgi:hypothetical protein
VRLSSESIMCDMVNNTKDKKKKVSQEKSVKKEQRAWG